MPAPPSALILIFLGNTAGSAVIAFKIRVLLFQQRLLIPLWELRGYQCNVLYGAIVSRRHENTPPFTLYIRHSPYDQL